MFYRCNTELNANDINLILYIERLRKCNYCLIPFKTVSFDYLSKGNNNCNKKGKWSLFLVKFLVGKGPVGLPKFLDSYLSS